VGTKQFDRKFGADLLRDLPAEPAVYLFKAEDGTVLYAGKAKNIRRRLASYRNATRRKAHRKMRTLVRRASSLEVRVQVCNRTPTMCSLVPQSVSAILKQPGSPRTGRGRRDLPSCYGKLMQSLTHSVRNPEFVSATCVCA
jgi:hypothetical protein